MSPKATSVTGLDILSLDHRRPLRLGGCGTRAWPSVATLWSGLYVEQFLPRLAAALRLKIDL